MEEIIEKIKKESDPFSKAKLINHLLKNKEIKLLDLSKKLSVTSSYLCHLKRLLDLPELIIDGYYSKMINLSNLFLISRVKDKEKMIKIYEKVLAENLTTKQTEELIREEVYHVKNIGDYLKNEEKEAFLNLVKKKFNDVKVKVVQTRTRLKIVFEADGSLKRTSEIFKKLKEVFK